MEKIRKFFNFVPFYGTLGFKGNLEYTQKSNIGPKWRFLKEKWRKTVKIVEKPRKSLQDTGADSPERFTDIIGSLNGF